MNELTIYTNNVPSFKNCYLNDATKSMFRIADSMRKCAFQTAYIMARVHETKCYEDDGFSSVHDWAMQTFGFGKSASYSLLRIGQDYTAPVLNDKGKVVGYAASFDAETENADLFTVSQVEKMLPISKAVATEMIDAGDITPAMSCKEIEKAVKQKRKELDGIVDEEPEYVRTEIGEDAANDVPAEKFYTVAIVKEDDTIGEERFSIPLSVLAEYMI